MMNHNEICADNKHESLIAEVFDENGEWRANARLIAAAPDILDAAEEALEDLKGWKMAVGTEECPETDERILKLERAIAKAYGDDA